MLQAKVANGEAHVVKVAGDKNIADALTKPVDGNKTAEHVARVGGRFKEGRHELAPEIAAEEDESVEQGEAEENEE